MAKKKEVVGAPFTEANKVILREALRSYSAEVNKLAKKSEKLGLDDKAESFKDTLRNIGAVYAKISDDAGLEEPEEEEEK